jgi:SAM-dependent methyltransferase
LDCGCGAGDNARILKDRGWQVTAVTIDPHEQRAVAKFCESVHIGDLERGLPAAVGSGYDAVVASHVLEHLRNPEYLFRDIQKTLKPNGVLAVALPNIAHYRQRVAFMRGGFNYTETGQLDRTHLRFYTYWTAIALLEGNGYRLITSVADGSLPWWWSRRVLPEKMTGTIDKWAVSHRPNLFGHQSLLLAEPE